MRHSNPPLTVHIDCAAVLTMIAKGPKLCTAARTQHADVWRRIWRCIQDIGQGEFGVQFAKCAAHRTKATAAKLPPFERYVYELNDVADSWAKHGADEDVPIQWHVQALRDQHDKVRSVARFMAHVEAATRDGHGGRIDTADTQGRTSTEDVRRPRSRPTRSPRVPNHPHMLRYRHGVLTCDVCPRRATTVKSKYRMQYEECKRMHKYDTTVGKHGGSSSRLSSVGHVVWRTGPWTWCHRCGVHSMHKVLGLKVACKGRFANSQAQVRRDRLRIGRHPYTDVELDAEPRPLPRRAAATNPVTGPIADPVADPFDDPVAGGRPAEHATSGSCRRSCSARPTPGTSQVMLSPEPPSGSTRGNYRQIFHPLNMQLVHPVADPAVRSRLQCLLS